MSGAAAGGRAGSVTPPGDAGGGKPKGKGKQRRRRVNISAIKGPSVECIRSSVRRVKGWRVSESASQQDDVYVVLQREHLYRRISTMSAESIVSKFPGMYEMCEKVFFTRAMNFSFSLMGVQSRSFWPQTWILPEAFEQVRVAMAGQIKQHDAGGGVGPPPAWIVKPDAGTQGEGIFLVESYEVLSEKMRTRLSRGSWVIQEYIHNPLLLDGLKFDLRIYATLVSIDPVQVYVCKEGLARFCTAPYSPPKRGAKGFSGSENAHLTNYTLNKHSEDFKHAKQSAFSTDNKASKRPISTLIKQLKHAAAGTGAGTGTGTAQGGPPAATLLLIPRLADAIKQCSLKFFLGDVGRIPQRDGIFFIFVIQDCSCSDQKHFVLCFMAALGEPIWLVRKL